MSQFNNIFQCDLQFGRILKGCKNMSNKLTYFLTCGRVITDTVSKLFTFIDVFDSLFIPSGSDFIYRSICVVARVDSIERGEIRAEIRFVYPDNSESAPVIITGNAQPGPIQLAATFPVLKFTQIGKYYLRIKFQDQELDRDDRFYFNVLKLT